VCGLSAGLVQNGDPSGSFPHALNNWQPDISAGNNAFAPAFARVNSPKRIAAEGQKSSGYKLNTFLMPNKLSRSAHHSQLFNRLLTG